MSHELELSGPGECVHAPRPTAETSSARSARQPYHRPEVSKWGTIEELTLGPIFPNDDMDGTGSQPI